MTGEGAAALAVMIVFGLLCLSAILIFAGAAAIERRVERWERYERWMHPPDDNGDGVTLLEDDNDADN